MGPLTLSDYVGLDTCLSILEGWTKDYPDDPAFFIPKVNLGSLYGYYVCIRWLHIAVAKNVICRNDFFSLYNFLGE